MLLTREESRFADRRAVDLGLPSALLMENAGRGAAKVLVSLGLPGPVAVCCGKSNNGGDGLVLARHLHRMGFPVRVHLFGPPKELGGESAIHWRIAESLDLPRRIHPLHPFDEADFAAGIARCAWCVDALFGTGTQGPLRAPFDRIVTVMNEAPALRFALDLPSGLDADTGEPQGPTVRADHTATFGFAKRGFDNPGARAWLGRVHVVDIGLHPSLMLAASHSGMELPAMERT